MKQGFITLMMFLISISKLFEQKPAHAIPNPDLLN